MVKIDPQMKIAELAQRHPEVVNFLIYEYGFHCVGCFISEFENLEDGARVHGIEGEDFEEMLKRAEEIANETQSS